MKIKIIFTESAYHDLEDIENYYKDIDVGYKKIINNILNQIQYLESFPTMGTSLYEIINVKNNYRFTHSENYVIFYTYINGTIYIGRILHSKRNYLKILLDI